jgi:UDP-N-acetylglucosamine 2-epimerase (non-hydrolysing)
VILTSRSAGTAERPRNRLSVERKRRKSVFTVFGTRPEVIKLAPVLRQLEKQSEVIRTINIASGQHADLVYPLVDLFGIRVDFDLCPMVAKQNPQAMLPRVVRGVSDVLEREEPDCVLVQGDTTTALAGAIAGHQRGVPVAHEEAGLRSGNILSPYPEEMNRSWPFAAAWPGWAKPTPSRQEKLAWKPSRQS